MEKVRLGEVCQMQSGGTPLRSNPLFWEKGTIPWAKISDLETSSDGYIYQTEEYITKDGLNAINNRFFSKGTLLLAMYGSVGKTAITNIDLTTNQAILGINPQEDKLNTKYLLYWFKNIQERLLDRAVGVALSNISKTIVSGLEIPLPTLSIQQTIASQLDKAQELIQYNQQLLEKYDELQQSLFFEMFDDPVVNEKGWEVKRLDRLGEFKNGLNYSFDNNGNRVKILGVGDFKKFWKLDNTSMFSEVLIKEDVKEEYYLKDNDLVFVRSNGNKKLVGRCVVVFPKNEFITYSGFCIRFRKKSLKINSIFLTFLFSIESYKENVFKFGRGANIQNINQKMLSQINIILPPLSLQNEFSSHIKSIEFQKEQVKSALEKSEEIYNSLLQSHFE